MRRSLLPRLSPLPTRQMIFVALATITCSVVVACGSGPDDSAAEAGIADRQEAIWNGFNDVNTPAANAVVRLAGASTCTGTLISPTLVLTANHCVAGTTGDCTPKPAGVGVGTPVQVGLTAGVPIQPDSATPWKAASTVVAVTPMLPGPTRCFEDTDSDLALLDIYPPIVNEAYPARPTFAAIPTGAKTLKIVGWGLTQAATLPTTRQFVGPIQLAADVDYEPDETGEIRLRIFNNGVYSGTDGGDSGGPLFLLRANGAFDQVGVLFGGRGAPSPPYDSVWTNITNDGNNTWVTNAAADPNRPGKWRGEGDYVGPCNTTLDPDCDHFYDAPICTVTNGKETCKLNDNCPGVYNPAQLASLDIDGDGKGNGGPSTDDDGDGIPSYCDTKPFCNYFLEVKGYDDDGDGLCGEFDALCPNDVLNDADGDGVCDGGGKDNCPGLANDQANCNEQAEFATKSTVLGDACDPVPCPGFLPNTSATKECADAGCTTVTTLPVDVPNLTVKALGSRSVGGTGTEFGVSAATDHRYCIQGEYPHPVTGAPTSTKCFDSDAVSDSFLAPQLIDEDAASRFHRVRVNFVSNASSQTPAILYRSDQPEVGYRWRYDLDFPVWAASTWGVGWIKDPTTQLPLVPTFQTGRYWMHARTPVGQTQALGANGLHTKLDGTPGESLANHYQPVYPVTQSTIWIPPLSTSCLPPFGCFQPFDHCIGSECLEAPCVGSGCPQTCLSCEFGDFATFDPYESRVLGAIQGGDIGLLTKAGGFIRVGSESLSAGTRALLTNPNHGVLHTVEPNRHIGRGLDLPQALVLDTSTFGVVESLKVRGTSMFTGRELFVPDDDSFTGVIGARTAALPAAAPTSRTQPQALYSSAVGLAFMLGGKDGAGQPLHDIWSYSVDAPNDGWAQLEVRGTQLGSVIAATFAYADRRLWVLDEVKGPFGLKLARLLQINPFTGASKVIGAWPRLGLYNQHWLGIDRDGSVLLTASTNRGGGSHLIVRLATRGDVRVTGVFSGRKALSSAPIVDRAGYTFVGPAQLGSGAAYDVQRTRSLAMGSGGWTHLAGCL